MCFRRPLFSVLGEVFHELGRLEAQPVTPQPKTMDEVVMIMLLTPLMGCNLRARLDHEISISDASPTGGGGAVASEFKREPDTDEHDGSHCFMCKRCFGNQGRLPCPAYCGVALCSLSCIALHRKQSCRRSDQALPRFGERFADERAPLSHAVARQGGFEVQMPFGLAWGTDFFTEQGKAVLRSMEDDPLLAAEHWAPESALFCQAREAAIVLPSGRAIAGPQPLRDARHVMGFPWVSNEMKGRLRKSNQMALKALKRGKLCAEEGKWWSLAHPFNSWLWSFSMVQDTELAGADWSVGSARRPGGGGEEWFALLHCPRRLQDYLHFASSSDFCSQYARALFDEFYPKGFSDSRKEQRQRWLAQQLGEATERLKELAGNEQVLDYLWQQEQQLARGAEFEHLQALVRQASHRGTDTRTLIQLEEDVHELPYPAYRWWWKEVMSYRWKHSGHINELELCAFIAMLKRRARNNDLACMRYVHVVDSMVTRAAVAKGRSSAPRVNRLLRRVTALVLAMDCYPMVTWTTSGWNFSDAASRR